MAGAIDIIAGDVRLFGNSDITTYVSSGAGGAGEIKLKANSIIAFDDSDILAYARDGSGGNITLETPAFFGLGYAISPPSTAFGNLDNNNRVDINASGAIAPGTITLTDTTFLQNSLTKLPTNVIDTSNLIANSCIARGHQQKGSFLITGAGGLPTLPDDPSNAPFQTYVVPSVGASSALPSTVSSITTSNNPTSPTPMPLVEAQGWVIGPDGSVILTANPSTGTLHSPRLTPPTCHSS